MGAMAALILICGVLFRCQKRKQHRLGEVCDESGDKEQAAAAWEKKIAGDSETVGNCAESNVPDHTPSNRVLTFDIPCVQWAGLDRCGRRIMKGECRVGVEDVTSIPISNMILQSDSFS